MKVVVTGAAGFLGLNIVKALQEAGHEPVAYVRASTDRRFLDQQGVRHVLGELDDAVMLEHSMVGAEGVIHCAGNTSTSWRDIEQLKATNVEGTRHVVDAAVRAGVRRLVFTSTTSTIGARNDPGFQSDESCRLDGFRSRSPYAMTKSAAEDIVLQAQASGLETVIVNPAEVIGPFDHNLQWGRMVLAACANRIPFLPPGAASFCSAEEVGRAHVAALSRGQPGSRYILAGTNASFRDFLEAVFRAIGRRADIPDGAYWARVWRAWLQDALVPLTRRAPLVDPYRMRVFGGHYYFNSSKAVQELGYQARALDEMVDACYRWYREHRFI